MKTFIRCFATAGILGLVFISSCRQDSQSYNKPALLSDGWEVSTPDEEGMNMSQLSQAVEKCRENKGVDGFIVARHGKLVAEEYFNGYGADKRHKIWSITKSVSSALVGIAIEKGFMGSVDDSMERYMGPYAVKVPADKKSITIRHLLTMTSGIEWVELGGPRSAGYKVAYAPDWVGFVLEQPVTGSPGKVYNYSSGNYMLLAPVMQQATGRQADAFADTFLFAPMGIKDYEWVKCSEFWTKTEGGEFPSVQKPEPPIQYSAAFADYPSMGSGLKMLPRDMAKFGQLYLDKGKWKENQLIPADWVEQSTRSQFGNPYGYGWRLRNYKVRDKETPCFYATGFGLQAIYVIPEYKLVIVFTQQHYRDMEEGERKTQEVVRSVLEGIEN